MEYLYETIEHKSRLPINIFAHTISNFPYHWHEDIEILFVLKGSVELTVDNKKTSYREGNIFVINSNDLHSLLSTSEDNLTTLLALQFNLNHFSEYGISSETRFNIGYEKEGSAKRDAYNKLRLILATLMRTVINKEEPQQIIIERNLLDLIIVLMNNFIMPKETDENRQTEQKRIIQIIKFINANCKDRNISLETVAENFHLNSQYLSRYFKTHVGISFKKFIDNMRLNKSLEALKYTDERIIDIALSYGFADAKSYYRVFKDILDTTPAEYREENKVETHSNRPKDYFSINKKETLSKLFEYLKYDKQLGENIKHTGKKLKVDVRKHTKEYDNTALLLTTFGYAPHGLRQDFNEQLSMLQSDIGFEYIRFHGIFADELLAYNEKADGEVYYNFNHIDELIDNLLSNNIRPFLEIGFMPKDLASTDTKIFWWECRVSPPKDMDKWLDFLEAFIRHILNRYGVNEVLSWYFEFWNEPEMMGAFFDGDVNAFYHFFKKSYDRIKSVNNNIKVGGFGTIYFNFGLDWMNDFALLAEKDDLKMDFSTFHVYQTAMDNQEGITDLQTVVDFGQIFKDGIDHGSLGAVLGGSEYISQTIDNCIDTLNALDINRGEYFITEFNASTNSRDLVHDTCYMASYIVKNMLDNMDKVSGIGYWTFTDIFEEFRLPQPIFHGGFGLITYNGIKKPSYNAYVFLSKLGKELVYKSDEMIITKTNDDYQILLYNYCHYNQLYSKFDYSQISVTNRYDVFENPTKKDITLMLAGIEGKYMMETQRVNREHGSSYDAWVNIGAPKNLSKEAHEYICSASIPSYEYSIVHIDRSIELTIELEPHEIQLITFKKQY